MFAKRIDFLKASAIVQQKFEPAKHFQEKVIILTII